MIKLTATEFMIMSLPLFILSVVIGTYVISHFVATVLKERNATRKDTPQ